MELKNRRVDALDMRHYSASRYGEMEIQHRRLKKGRYLIGAIRSHRESSTGTEYLVHSFGYFSEHDSWEPESSVHLSDAYKSYIKTLQKNTSPSASGQLS